MKRPAIATAAVALYYAWGAIVLWQTYGHYRATYLASFFGAWVVAMGLATRGEVWQADLVALPVRWLWAWCAILPLVWVVDVVLLYPEPGLAFAAFRTTGVVVSGLVASAAIAANARGGTSSRRPEHRLTAAIAVCLLAKLLVLRASPWPHIDVFRWLTEASDHLLAGRDPYSQVYRDLYAGQYDHAPGVPYWPATLLVTTLSRGLAGDVRMGFVVAQGLACLAIFRLARARGASALEGRLYVLAWLVYPVGFLVHEQSWVDPLLVAAFAWVAVWLDREGPWSTTSALAVTLGFAVGVKQYAVLGAAVTLVQVARAAGGRAALRATALAASVVTVLLVPFAIADAHGLYRMTVKVPATQLLRPDALSMLVPMAPLLPDPWPSRVTALMAVVSVALACVWLWTRPRPDVRAWALAMAFAYGLFFFFAKLAFCNYHYFAAFFVFLYVATSRFARLTTPEGRGNKAP